jgi:DNA-binding transcriptional LysR family regulator
MEIRQLRYFVTVAELGHFGRAAEALHVVQPAVSQAVARLEREIGLTLFDRSRKRITLTPEGRSFVPHARRVLRAVERAGREAADLAAGVTGLIRIGSSEGLGPRLEAILAEFRRHRPAVRVELLSQRTPAKIAALTAGDLDAAFVRAAEPAAGVTVHHLWDERLLLAVPAGRAAPGGGPVELAELADLPLARTGRRDNPGVFDIVTAACQAAGFTPLPGPSLVSVQDVLAGPVAAGECWTLLYAATMTHPVSGVATVAPRSPLHVPTGLAVADPPRSALVGELVSAARSIEFPAD